MPIGNICKANEFGKLWARGFGGAERVTHSVSNSFVAWNYKQ